MDSFEGENAKPEELSAFQEKNISIQLPGYPVVVSLSKDSSRTLSQGENAKSAFLPHDETVWKRAYHAWYEMGLSGTFEEIVNSKSEVPEWTASMSKGMLALLRWGSSLHGSLFPHLSMSNEDLISQFTSIADWSASPVRAFSWHPHTTKFAYALQDDSIRVHSAAAELTPVLKHKLQKNVADLAWKPLSASVLAVACQSCVLIWHVKPTSLAARPSSSSVQVLQQSGPVTCLSWRPDGRTLLSASPVDTAIMAWDVPMETCVPLRRVGGGGVSYICWSPEGSKVFSATPSRIFRVWETTHWSCEAWSKRTSRCKSACWSPDGDILLFATENEPIIYSLTFSTSQEHTGLVIGGSQTAVACVDLSELVLQSETCQETNRNRPCVQTMSWDPTGERLAVLFQDDEGSGLQIALFRTRTHPVLEIMPCGFVTGEEDEVPHHIAFQPKFDKGALLSVVWSSGSIRYVPLYYVPSNKVGFDQLHRGTSIGNGQPNTTLYSLP